MTRQGEDKEGRDGGGTRTTSRPSTVPTNQPGSSPVCHTAASHRPPPTSRRFLHHAQSGSSRHSTRTDRTGTRLMGGLLPPSRRGAYISIHARVRGARWCVCCLPLSLSCPAAPRSSTRGVICPGKPYPDSIRTRPPAIRLSSVHRYPDVIRPGGVRAASLTVDTKEVHGAPAAAAVHGTFLVLTQVCLHTLWPPI